jgi:hypothetical protein
MWQHVGFAREAPRQINRPDVIEEDERPDHAQSGVRQDAGDLEAAAAAPPLIDYQFDRCFIRLGYGTDRFHW